LVFGQGGSFRSRQEEEGVERMAVESFFPSLRAEGSRRPLTLVRRRLADRGKMESSLKRAGGLIREGGSLFFSTEGPRGSVGPGGLEG